MEFLNLIICAGNTECLPFRTDTFLCHPVVNASLIWAITILLLGVMLLIFLHILQCRKNKLKKDMADAEHAHELALKAKAHEYEKEWYDIKKNKNDNETINNLKNEIEQLKNDKSKTAEDNIKLKDAEIELLKKQLELYKNAVEELKLELRTK